MHQRYLLAATAKDVDAILPTMADDVRLHSPTKLTPFQGKPMVRFLFGHLLQVLEEFQFTHVDAGDRSATLHFTCRIGGREATGVDILRFDERGLITDFTVAIRPLPALLRLNEIMGERLAAMRRDDDSAAPTD